MSVEERYYVQRITDQIERAITGATSALRSFAAPPGRKALLLLSVGWPVDAAEYVLNDFTRMVADATLVRGDALLRPLTDTANQLGYTVYAVDVPGLQERTAGLSSCASCRRRNPVPENSCSRSGRRSPAAPI